MNEEKSLFDYHSIQEIVANFSLDEVFKFAKEKILHEWLEINFYNEESEKIFNALENNLSDAEFKLLICKIFNYDFEKLSYDELEEISEVVAKNQRKKLFFDENTGNNKKSAFVENQAELIQALKAGAEVLFLYGGEFRISPELHDKTYIGRNNAIIDFTLDEDIDFDERNIIFEDLQIYIHYPVTLRIEKSKNIKILNGSKITLGTRPTLKEIFEILRERNPFESAENFRKRAEDIRGAAVGNVLLTDKNYNFDENKFSLRPQWNFEYISVLKNYLNGRDLFLNISPTDAELLYNNERKLQIFADFAYIDGKITILNLYLETLTLGRIIIENILRASENKISSGSGFRMGYGLHIITAYKNIEDLS